jgi:hypothetical protein
MLGVALIKSRNIARARGAPSRPSEPRPVSVNVYLSKAGSDDLSRPAIVYAKQSG